jgi:hypothetical protein
VWLMEAYLVFSAVLTFLLLALWSIRKSVQDKAGARLCIEHVALAGLFMHALSSLILILTG